MNKIRTLTAYVMCAVLLVAWAPVSLADNPGGDGEYVVTEGGSYSFPAISAEDTADALLIDTNLDAEAHVTVQGDVTNSIPEDSEVRDADAIHVGGEGAAELHVEGGAETRNALTEDGEPAGAATAVYVHDYALEDTRLTIDENVSADGDVAIAVVIDSDSGKTQDDNEILIHVGENVQADGVYNAMGISMEQYQTESVSTQDNGQENGGQEAIGQENAGQQEHPQENAGLENAGGDRDASELNPVNWNVEVEGKVAVKTSGIEEDPTVGSAIGVYDSIETGQASVTIGGGIEVQGSFDTRGAALFTSYNAYPDGDAKTELQVAGGVQVESKGAALGITGASHSRSSIQIDGEGEMKVQGKGFVAGLELTARDDSSIDVAYEGGIDVASTGYTAEAVSLEARGSGEISGKIEGNLEAVSQGEDYDQYEGQVAGVSMKTSGQGSVSLELTGNASGFQQVEIQPGGVMPDYGVKMVNEGGTLNLQMTGNASSDAYGVYIGEGEAWQSADGEEAGQNGQAHYYGLENEDDLNRADTNQGPVIVKDGGSLTGGYNPDGTRNEEDASVGESDGAAVTRAEITGDVSGGEYGLYVDHQQGEHELDVIVDGTVDGGAGAVVLTEKTTTEGMTLTVWQIELDEAGNAVNREQEGEDGQKELTADREAEKKVQYIIRINPEQTGMISTDAKDYEGYKVALEGETVTMRLNIEDGYDLLGVYGDVDQNVQLTQDAEGHYYLTVPRGGAVYLSLILEKNVAPVQESTVYANVTFHPNGGTLSGSEAPLKVRGPVGKRIETPVPDERDGYEFLGWYAGNVGPDHPNWKEPEEGTPLTEGGKRIRMERSVVYTAMWKQKE